MTHHLLYCVTAASMHAPGVQIYVAVQCEEDAAAVALAASEAQHRYREVMVNRLPADAHVQVSSVVYLGACQVVNSH